MIYLKLFFVFAKIGLFGFGGGMAMLPMIYQSAETFSLMSADEFSNLVAISQVTPGPIAVNAATYVGFNSAGYLGAFMATLGVALPSFVLVTIVCYFISKFKNSTIVEGAFVGIRPVTAGLIAAAVVFMGKSVVASGNIIAYMITFGTIILAGKFKMNPIMVIIIAGIIGALVCS